MFARGKNSLGTQILEHYAEKGDEGVFGRAEDEGGGKGYFPVSCNSFIFMMSCSLRSSL